VPGDAVAPVAAEPDARSPETTAEAAAARVAPAQRAAAVDALGDAGSEDAAVAELGAALEDALDVPRGATPDASAATAPDDGIPRDDDALAAQDGAATPPDAADDDAAAEGDAARAADAPSEGDARSEEQAAVGASPSGLEPDTAATRGAPAFDVHAALPPLEGGEVDTTADGRGPMRRLEADPFGGDTAPERPRLDLDATPALVAPLAPEPAEPPTAPAITAPDQARPDDVAPSTASAATTTPDTPRAALVEVEVTRAADDDVDAMLGDVFGADTEYARSIPGAARATPAPRVDVEARAPTPAPRADRAAIAAIERAAIAATERVAELERERRLDRARTPDAERASRPTAGRATAPVPEAPRDPPRGRAGSTIQPWQVASEGALSVPPLASEPPPPSRPSLSFVGRAPVPSPRRDPVAWTSHVEAAFSAWSSLPMSAHGDLESELRQLASGGVPPVAELRREAWVRASSRTSRPSAPREPEVELRERPSALVPPLSLAPEGTPEPRTSATQSVHRGPHPLPFEEAQSLLDALEGPDPARRGLAREVILARADELRPFLVRRFPGRVTVDPFEEGRAPPAFEGSGELLSVFAELGPRFSPEVAERLDDPLPLVRYFALLAFTVYPAAPQMPRIVRRLHDEEPEIAALALEIIRRQRGSPAMAGVLDHLRQRLESASPFARRQAAKLVGAIQDREIVPLLLPLLDRKDRGVADAAQDALTELAKQRLGPGSARWGEWWRAHREASCVTWLLAALDGNEASLRRAAAEALTRETGFDAGFDADAPRRGRDEAKRRWVDWWVAQRSGRPSA
jgi:hypothetical protein